MTLAVTSFIPTTGPTSGGTSVVITGTGLTAATSVMFGDVEGRIDTSATNTDTSLTVIAPAIDNANAGSVKITVLDSLTPAEAQSTTSYTYTAVTSTTLTSASASKWVFEVKSGASYVAVRGLQNFQPQVTPTTQDDSDYESVVNGVAWGSDVVTGLKWSNVVKLIRKTAAGYVEDPGQKVLRVASVQGGSSALVDCRWYDRNGGDEAYQGFGSVQWSDDGGTPDGLSTVSVTVTGRGARNTITNPA